MIRSLTRSSGGAMKCLSLAQRLEINATSRVTISHTSTPLVHPAKFSSRWIRTAVSKTDETMGQFLPPNLIFDNRSSFAPKSKPSKGMFVTPSTLTVDHEELNSINDDSKLTSHDDDTLAHDNNERLIVGADGDEEGDLDELTAIDDKLATLRPVVPLPERLKVNVHHGLDGSVSGTLWLESTVFGVDPIRIDLIKQAVDYIRNKIRGRRKAKSKTISEVSGSGRKVRQQKGTGKARAGHSRPAHWRGGAKAHGPKNTVDYGDVKMNKKTKRLAMSSVLSQKLKEGNLIVIDNLLLESHKTAPWASMLENTYGIGRNGSSALIVDHYLDSTDENTAEQTRHASHHGVPINLWVASANVPKVKVMKQSFANVYDILKREKLVLTLGALEILEKRLKR